MRAIRRLRRPRAIEDGNKEMSTVYRLTVAAFLSFGGGGGGSSSVDGVLGVCWGDTGGVGASSVDDCSSVDFGDSLFGVVASSFGSRFGNDDSGGESSLPTLIFDCLTTSFVDLLSALVSDLDAFAGGGTLLPPDLTFSGFGLDAVATAGGWGVVLLVAGGGMDLRCCLILRTYNNMCGGNHISK